MSPPSTETPYDADWFARRARWVRIKQSARIVLPSSLQLLEECGWPVRSVVDVGAGTGTWLAAAREAGVADIVAIEGDWVRRVQTEVPHSCYVFADLRDAVSIPRRFDLAISLEVAEHIPAARAPHLVDNITALSDVILFSAAVPDQGGTDHVNEQWPDYWARLFHGKGFRTYDVLRWNLWGNEDIPYWYRQNLILFVRNDLKDLCHALDSLSWRAVFRNGPLAVVHPQLYEELTDLHRRPYLWWLLERLPGALWRAISRRLRGILGAGKDCEK